MCTVCTSLLWFVLQICTAGHANCTADCVRDNHTKRTLTMWPPVAEKDAFMPFVYPNNMSSAPIMRPFLQHYARLLQLPGDAVQYVHSLKQRGARFEVAEVRNTQNTIANVATANKTGRYVR